MESPDKAARKWNEWTISELIFGIVIPTFVAFLIVGVAVASNPALIGLKYAFLDAIVIVGVPMLIGLIWNKWAGGA